MNERCVLVLPAKEVAKVYGMYSDNTKDEKDKDEKIKR